MVISGKYRTGKTSHQDGINKEASSTSINRVGRALDAARTANNVGSDHKNNEVNTPNAKTAINQQAETMLHKSDSHTSMLNPRQAEVPAVTRTNSLASSFAALQT